MNSPAFLCLTVFMWLILSSVISPQISVKHIMKYTVSAYISSSARKKASSLIQLKKPNKTHRQETSGW